MVSVVIPAYNESRGLAASLASIREAMRAFADAGLASELIVCDNNSSDDTAAIAAAAGARVVFEPINQISRARNTGARHAAGEWLLFVDADSHPPVALFADVARVIREGRCVAGGATIAVDRREPLAVRLVVAAWNAVSRAARWSAGACLFCEAAAFRELGGFSDALFISEDVELFVRLKRMARRDRRSIAILHRHPVQTSARKAHLYTPGEFVAFYCRVLFTFGRAMRDRDRLPIWYDGRR